jgi:hypothetical protein
MAQQIINTGAVANDGTGESLRAAFDAVNNNFSQIWASGPVNTEVVIRGNIVTVLGYNNNLTISGNGIGNIQANSTMVPAQDGVYDLGAVNRRFNSVHAQYFYGNGRFLTGISGGGTGGGQVTFSNSAPLVANIGDVWIEADTGVQYLYFSDNTSNQWAEMEAYQSFSSSGGTYGNTNVVANLAALGSNPVSTTGNVTAGYFLGNGSQLTGLAATYGNTNVVANLASLGSNPVSTTGNITAGYFLGNGSQLTGIAASYGNTNVVANLAALGSNPISTTGNITAGNILGGANVNATMHTGTTVSVTGNITGNYFIGNGRQLTGIVASPSSNIANGNSNVSVATSNGNVTVTSNGTNTWNFDTTGNATFPANGTTNLHDVRSVGRATFSNVQIGGNLNYAESANLIVVEDKDGFADIIAQNKNSGGNASMNIVLVNNDPGNVYMAVGVNSSTFTPLYNTLFEIPDAGYVSHSTTQVMGPQSAESGTSKMYFTYNSGSLALELNDFGAIGWGASYNGNLTQGNFGNVGQVLTSAGNSSPPTWNNAVSVAGNVTGGNILTVGLISATGNITGGNILTGGLISATGNVSGNYFIGNGSQLTGIAASYGNANVATFLAAYGSNTVSTTGNITGGNLLTGGLISATGNVTGNYILGNGSQLTGIVSSYGNANVVANLAALGSNPVSTTGNVTGGNVLTGGVISSTGNITGGNISATNHTGTTVSVTGNITAANFFGNGNTLSNVATRFESSWTVPVGNSTQSFTVPINNTYQLWVLCNIPNGIISYQATVSVTNTNVPVLGTQRAWNYTGGGSPILLTTMPTQIVGAEGTISTAGPATTTANRFDFGINNTSGGSVTVRYGWVAIS